MSKQPLWITEESVKAALTELKNEMMQKSTGAVDRAYRNSNHDEDIDSFREIMLWYSAAKMVEKAAQSLDASVLVPDDEAWGEDGA